MTTQTDFLKLLKQTKKNGEIGEEEPFMDDDDDDGMKQSMMTHRTSKYVCTGGQLQLHK